MIYSSRVRRTLSFLDRKYNKSLTNSDQEVAILFAKMAVLEYCGWLEATFDEIARNCVRRKLRTFTSRKILEDKISKTYGFTYETNVRPLLVYGLGSIRLLKVENKLNTGGDLDSLKSELGQMNVLRREAAHTFTSGRTSRFDAPSRIIANLNKTEPVLKDLWKYVCED